MHSMNIERCVGLLEKMVSIPSESKNEEKFARFLEKYLRENLSMRVNLQHVEGKSYNVIGTFGTGKSDRTLILGGHIDTVAPTEAWKTDPYTLTREKDMLRGLGAGDMKGGLACQITVLRQILEERKPIDADVIFFGFADEERCSIGANAFVKKMLDAGERYKNPFFIMGEPHFDNIVIGATGKVLFQIIIRGTEAQAATPEDGVNAIDCMARFINAVHEKYDRLYRKGDSASFCFLKVNSAYREYSLTVPNKCQAILNKQLTSKENADDFKNSIEELYKKEVGMGELVVKKITPSYPSYRLPENQPDMKAIYEHVQNDFHRKIELRINHGVSDGNILFTELGIPTILYGPQGVNFHTENEYVSEKSLAQYMEELYSYIIQEYIK